jgi:putative SOS response-associated peptidase YedK
MCGRFSLTFPIQELLDCLEVEWHKLGPRFNIAPTQDIPILRLDPKDKIELVQVHWGLIPAWADQLPKPPLINACCETVMIKPSFRCAFRHRRCLVPATGFYEWKKEGRKRFPFHITYHDGSPMLFAGIWDRWNNPSDANQIIESCAIITCDASPEVEPLHHRMPVLIQKESSDLWLSGDPESAEPLMVPYAMGNLRLTPANPVVKRHGIPTGRKSGAAPKFASCLSGLFCHPHDQGLPHFGRSWVSIRRLKGLNTGDPSRFLYIGRRRGPDDLQHWYFPAIDFQQGLIARVLCIIGAALNHGKHFDGLDFIKGLPPNVPWRFLTEPLQCAHLR